jgi:cytosine permease
MFNLHGDGSRKTMTLVFALVGILLALLGIMDHFVNFLYAIALIVPVIAGVIMAHFFFVNKTATTTQQSWNWLGTLSILVGLLVGYLTQYQIPFGFPAVQSLLVSGALYTVLTRMKNSKLSEQPI